MSITFSHNCVIVVVVVETDDDVGLISLTLIHGFSNKIRRTAGEYGAECCGRAEWDDSADDVVEVACGVEGADDGVDTVVAGAEVFSAGMDLASSILSTM